MLRVLRLLSLLCLSCCCALAADPPKKRTWQDASGQFSVEAEFVSLAEGKITLRKNDGKVLTLPLDKLSAADQAIAQQLATPVTPMVAIALDADKMPVMTTAVWGDAKVETVVCNDLEEINLRDSLNAQRLIPWRVAPFNSPPPLAGPPQTIDLTYPRLNLATAPLNFVFDVPNQCAWISCNHKDRDGSLYRLDRLNLTTGRFSAAFDLGRENRLLAVDAASGRLVTADGEGQVHLWKLAGDQLTRQKSLLMVKKSRDTSPLGNARLGYFLGKDHFALDNGYGLYIISLADFKPIRRIYCGVLWRSPYQFLPGNKQFVFTYEHMSGLVDPLTGKVQGSLLHQGLVDSQDLALSSDHRLLYVMDLSELVQIYDLRSGKLTNTVEIPDGIRWRSELSESPPGFLCLGGRGLVDLARPLPMVSFEVDAKRYESAGGRHFFLVEREQANNDRSKSLLTLVHGEIPDAALLAKINAIKPEDLRLLKPGARLALQYDRDFVVEVDNDIAKALTKKLAGTGVTIVKNDTATHEFRYTHTEDAGKKSHHVALVEKASGKTLWEKRDDDPGGQGRLWLKIALGNLNDQLVYSPQEAQFAVEITPAGIRDVPVDQRTQNQLLPPEEK